MRSSSRRPSRSRRSGTTKAAAAAAPHYWAFELRFTNRNRVACAGCSEPKVLLWQKAIFESNDGSLAVEVMGPGKLNDCVTLNGAAPALCEHLLPVRATTWGRIKSMYR